MYIKWRDMLCQPYGVICFVNQSTKSRKWLTFKKMVSFANEYIPANETLSERIEYIMVLSLFHQVGVEVEKNMK